MRSTPSTGHSFSLSRRTLLKSASLGFAAGAFGAKTATAAEGPPLRRLTTGWEHFRGTLGGIWEVWRGDKASDNVPWDKVELPHCFNARDAVDPDQPYYQGPGWYRTRIKHTPKPGNRLLLHFEGAGQRSEVYVFMEKVGQHLGGYDEFTFDITDAVERARKRGLPAGEIPISVLCDNSRDLERIPSSLSDFVLYGGLYRHVNLVEVPAISLTRVLIDSTVAADGSAKLAINTRFWNPTQSTSAVTLSVVVTDPDAKVVYEKTSTAKAGAGTHALANFGLQDAKLWSTKKPQRYLCRVTLKSDAGEMTVSEPFGLRRFEFKKHGPFELNGERLLLRGTHRHEDHAGLGAAVTDDIVRAEMQLIKDMGANFIRLGHYQQSRLVLDLCDELGLLVWEEIPWCRGGLGGERYKKQARDMLTAMIDQHRNHPSIILWGLGNENDWPGDFEVFDEKAIRAFMRELHELSHKLDPSRKTAIRRCDFCRDIVDVYSPSIWAGWYRGLYTEYKASSEKELKRVNHFLHVEWGGDSHAGRFAEDADKILSKISTGGGTDERGLDYLLTGGQARASKDGDWSETYICNLFDWHLKEQETMPWLTGTAQWVFKDFATPLRPENPVPRVNQKGLVERDLTLKDGYYVFQSYWAEKPMVRIAGHRFSIRWGGKGEAKMVKVYSNCAEAELFLNGKSLGVRKRKSEDFPAAGLRWMTPFRDGENRLEVRARQGSTEVKDEVRFRYQTAKWGTPARLLLTRVNDGAPAKANEKAKPKTTVEARLVDDKGVPCLDSRLAVRFDLAGGGRLLDNLGTNGGSRKVELANGRARISIELGADPSVVSVSGENLKGALLTIGPRGTADKARA
ncbi:MAG TPA: glycoside hydrolase family 2 TIM barrel-domain containing protein [Polyangia bacterium]